MKYDYLLVGCGLHNATFARHALDAGRRVLIVDKRDHIAGNCYDETRQGINVHAYGPHQFHTRNREVWRFVNRFAEFNHYRAHIKANFADRIYSMPPNMALYHQLWGVTTPEEARKKVEEVRIPRDNPRNLRDLIWDALGEEVYRHFYYGYSLKQWGVDPSEIPVAVGRRLPIRFDWNDRWFDDEYEGIPKDGYAAMIANMIDGADVQLGVDYLEHRKDFSAAKTVYTGKVDEYFGYRFGVLGYRTLEFRHETVSGDFQGNAIVNYTHPTDHAFTRITEHKHFNFTKSPHSVITREIPREYEVGKGQVPYYPVNNEKNQEVYRKYQQVVAEDDVIFGGRLGTYKYLDMDTVIGQAMVLAKREGLTKSSDGGALFMYPGADFTPPPDSLSRSRPAGRA